MKKMNWEIVEDMNNEETGEPTCWTAKIDSKDYGRYVWITKYADKFAVEINSDVDFKTLATCKSLTSAKRWVAKYIL